MGGKEGLVGLHMIGLIKDRNVEYNEQNITHDIKKIAREASDETALRGEHV